MKTRGYERLIGVPLGMLVLIGWLLLRLPRLVGAVAEFARSVRSERTLADLDEAYLLEQLAVAERRGRAFSARAEVLRDELVERYRAEGRSDEGAAVLEHALAVAVERGGPDGLDALGVRHAYAWALADAGRLAEALDHHVANLDARSRAFGHHHHDTILSCSAAADLHRALGHREEAAALAQLCLRAIEQNVSLPAPLRDSLRVRLVELASSVGPQSTA